jgi:serine/threonine protein kinase
MSETFGINSTISHYRIVSKLGAGGMGEVYLAEDTRSTAKWRSNFCPRSSRRMQERVRRFVQEAKAASALNHPNIITIYEIGETTACTSSPPSLLTARRCARSCKRTVRTYQPRSTSRLKSAALCRRARGGITTATSSPKT